MPHDYFDYTREKLTSFQQQIAELRAGDFPIPKTERALTAIQDVFIAEAHRLSTLPGSSAEVKKAACAQVNLKIKKFLPLLGFILRSTNVRNSFELADPLSRLSERLLKRDLTFILSSEWNFSPLTYRLSFEELPDIIFLGLPAFESGNALIIPLAGHELGHWIWRNGHLDTQLIGPLQEAVLNFYRDEWNEFCELFWKKDIGDIKTDTAIREVWTSSFSYAIRQCEEVFADFMGLHLFGVSYLHSFEYLLAPRSGEVRACDYPDMGTRAAFLQKAAARFAVTLPDDYIKRFDNSPGISDPAEEFIVRGGDAATRESVDNLLEFVERISQEPNFPTLSSAKELDYLNRFKKGIPAEGADYIGDIVNAGWAAYRDETAFPTDVIGDRRKIDVLNEFLLKTIEVAEIETLMGESDATLG
jgi:hypothetical protein